jgi:hypothetical protein
MRHEASFLKDILNACSKIEAITAATSEGSERDRRSHQPVVAGTQGATHLQCHGGRSWPCATGLSTPISIWTRRSCRTQQWMRSRSSASRSAEYSKVSSLNRSCPDGGQSCPRHGLRVHNEEGRGPSGLEASQGWSRRPVTSLRTWPGWRLHGSRDLAVFFELRVNREN